MTAELSALTNPMGLISLSWLGAYALVTSLKLILDHIVVSFVGFLGTENMPSRGKGGKDGDAVSKETAGAGLDEWLSLDNKDKAYMAINSVIEFIFVNHVIVFVMSSPLIKWELSELGLVNTAVALFLLFAVDDFFYTPCHLLMHWRPLYPWIHKHHHKSTMPSRGYLDAGNEHPAEQLIGLSCLWMTLHAVPMITGLHVVTLVAHFALYAALAMLNHTPYDLSFSWLGFEYSVRAHEMHHRLYTCNYAQYFMLYDKLLGTYRPYKA